MKCGSKIYGINDTTFIIGFKRKRKTKKNLKKRNKMAPWNRLGSWSEGSQIPFLKHGEQLFYFQRNFCEKLFFTSINTKHTFYI